MSWSSPTSSDPPPPASSSLQVCPNHILTLLSTQLTLLFQPFIDPPCPPTPFRMQFQVLKQRTGFFAICPINLSSSSPHAISIRLCWIYGVSFLIPVCLYILVPLSQSQGAVYQHTEGRWKMGPAIPSCSSRGPPCLLSSHSPQWVHLTIYEPLPPPRPHPLTRKPKQ